MISYVNNLEFNFKDLFKLLHIFIDYVNSYLLRRLLVLFEIISLSLCEKLSFIECLKIDFILHWPLNLNFL